MRPVRRQLLVDRPAGVDPAPPGVDDDLFAGSDAALAGDAATGTS
jgi:hypothetical protein